MPDEPRLPLWARELEEPEIPDGWHTGPPDFVGVGAQRSGTTWWFRGAIRPHPEFRRPFKPLKEVHFFDRYWKEEPPADLADRYARLFPRPPGAITGEWTPRYMCDPWAIRMLAEAAPEARILIMLRDPVERYHSGLEREARLAEQGGTSPSITIVGDAIYRSMYHRQVERVIELFGRDRVLVLQYERCLDDPLGEMHRTHEFLGIEPLRELTEKLGGARPARGSRVGLPESIRAELVELLSDDIARLAELCPEIDLGLWPSARTG
jgi:Sulfotransferase domain